MRQKAYIWIAKDINEFVDVVFVHDEVRKFLIL